MKVYHYSKLVLFVIFSVLIIAFANELLANLRYFIGALFLAYSLEGEVKVILEEKKEFYKNPIIIYDFFQFIIGIIILVGVEEFSDICIFWGVVSLLRESFEISEILTKKVTGWAAIVSGIESIVVIVFCTLLLLNPTEEHAKTHIYLLIAELIVAAFPPALNELIFSIRANKKQK